MIRALRRWIGGTAAAHLIEQHDMLLRCARRCAYDLGHAIDLIPVDENSGRADIAEQLQHNQKHWIGLFASGNRMKDYRLDLHREIAMLEFKVERLYALLDAAGVVDPDDKRLPF